MEWMEIANQGLGQMLKKRRTEKLQTQEEAARELRVSMRAYCNWELG